MKKITILLGIVLLIFMGLPAKEASAADTDYKSVVSDLFFEDDEEYDFWEEIADPEEFIRIAQNVKEVLELGDDYKIRWADTDPYVGFYIYWSAVTDKARSTELETGVDVKGHIFCAYFLDLCAKNEENQTVLGTRKELQKNAEEIIYRMIPGSYGHIKVLEYPDSYEFDAWYDYDFTRIENSIEVPTVIHVEISKYDGKLSSADIEWAYDVEFPAPEKTISAGKAWKKFKKKAAVSLHYREKHISTFDESKNKYISSEQVCPVYWPKYSTIDIDAVTGKVSAERSGYGSNGFMAYDPYDDGIYLGYEVEPLQVDEKILSKDEAFDRVLSNKYLMIYPDLNEREAELYKLGGDYYWLLIVSNGVIECDDVDYYDPNAQKRIYYLAVVNAKTGNLEYYTSSGPKEERSGEELREAAKLSKKKCRKIFRKFLKNVFPEGYEYMEYSGTSNEDGPYYFGQKEITRSYYISYTRFSSGIPFNHNGARGTVDRETGKITHFYKEWTDREIPEAKNLIPEDEAIEVMYGGKQKKPVYVIDYNTDEYGNILSKSVRLVYRYELVTGDIRADRVSTEK